MVNRPARANGIGGHIDIKSFAEEVVDRLSNADMRLNPANENFPDAAIAPGGKDLAALAAAKSGLRRNRAEQSGQLGRRGAEPLWILLGRREWQAKQFCP